MSLLKLAGLQVGRGVRVISGVHFNSTLCELGDRSFLNEGCHVNATGAFVRIGKDVGIGPRVCLITSAHAIATADRRAGVLQPLAITIEDGCWLGAAATILPGATIATGCVIAAGAVVTRSTAPHGVYAGVPARRMRDLDPARAASSELA